MLSISFEHNLRDLDRYLGRIARDQMPFATARALTQAAKVGAEAVGRALERNLDRPTPFTLKAPAIVPARKSRLIAHVRIRDRQAEYLEILETGGTRRPEGRALLDPEGVRVNKYGNIPRRAVARLLAKPDVFSGTVRGVPGIWERRRGNRLRLLVAFNTRQQYRPQLGFEDAVRRAVSRAFPDLLEASVINAIRTAR